ncbi:MAG TPA: ABC transporter ATP-binding protein [Planctomycetota bacterium]|nr:ABC transporter ATP-binding protein [Planctomycetota bacterium]
MTDAVISVGGLVKTFGDRAALRDVSLTVPRGELLGLVGPNGAGKSTLLRTLIGLVQRTRGRVAVMGHDPATQSLAIRHRTCYLPGETGVYHQMTGQQFLDFALGFYPRHQAGLRQRLQEGFQLPLHQKVRSFSAGMKQKLALMATLIPDVDLYLLDEPDRTLDASMRFFLRDLLLAMKRQGKTVVLSSHHLGEVEALADRLVFLLDGTFVVPERLAAARASLRRRPRLRLCAGATLPAGARELLREPDGTLVVATDGDPMQWLRSVPDGVVESAEVGIPRLEDLYAVLLHDPTNGGGA